MKAIRKYLAFGMLLLIAPCAHSQLYVASFDSKFNRYAFGEYFEGASIATWNETAWKGERVNGQFVIETASKVSGFTFKMKPLATGTSSPYVIPSQNVVIRHAAYALGDPEARSCSGYSNHATAVKLTDPLLPTLPTTIEAADPVKLWITIDVPRDAREGLYSGGLEVWVDGYLTGTYPINLLVVAKTLPQSGSWDFHLDLWQYPAEFLKEYNSINATKIEVWSDAHFNLMEPAYKILADAGQKAITAHIKEGALGGPSMIKWIHKGNDSWEYDYSAFDKYVSRMMALGISKQINCFSITGWNPEVIAYFDEPTARMQEFHASITSKDFKDRWLHFLTQFKTHLDSKGWFDKTVLYLDEVSADTFDPIVGIIKGHSPNWKIGMTQVKEIDNSKLSQLYDLSRSLSLPESESLNGVNTFYTSCSEKVPNAYVASNTSPAEMTWMGWYASQANLDGYLRWAYDYWRNSTDPFDMRLGGNTAGDFAFIYRTSNTPPVAFVSSIRLELLREGIQDFEKIRILKESLANSTDGYDKDALARLNNHIKLFQRSSGGGSVELVSSGQNLLKKIVLGQTEYCKSVNNNQAPYIKSVTTTGASQNVNLTFNSPASNGYERSIEQAIGARAGGSFTVDLTIAPAGFSCVSWAMWIDFNGDELFSLDERVLVSEDPKACSGRTEYRGQSVVVPKNVLPGVYRARIRAGMGALGYPEPCSEISPTSTLDLNFNVVDQCAAVAYSAEYFLRNITLQSCIDNSSLSYDYAPSDGYRIERSKVLRMVGNSTVRMSLLASDKSNCATTRVWIDWNSNGVFTDPGEAVFAGGSATSCINSIQHFSMINVPNVTAAFETRMRIQLADSYLPEQGPCSTNAHTTDFRVKIEPGSSNSEIFKNCAPIILSPAENSILQTSAFQLSWTPYLFPARPPSTHLGYRVKIFRKKATGEDLEYQKDMPTNVTSVNITEVLYDGNLLRAEVEVIGGFASGLVSSVQFRSFDPYCDASGGANDSYYVIKAATAGAKSNLSYNTNTFPTYGYHHETSSRIVVEPGTTVTVQLTTSLPSYCANMVAWLDWNMDNVFDSAEQVFADNNGATCTAAQEISFQLQVPSTAVPGLRRMRVRLQDGNSTPTPCGQINFTGTADFDVMVASKLKPVAHYELNSNVLDISGNGYHGVNKGARPATDRHGRANAALSFDGDDFIDVSSFRAIGAKYSISVWVSASESLAARNEVVSFGQTTAANGAFLQKSSLRFRTDVSGVVGPESVVDAPLNKWVNVIVTNDGTKGSLWVDGNLEQTKDLAANLLAGKLWIGKAIYNEGNFWKGKIDDLMIFDRVLTAQEIFDIADDVAEPAPLAFYPMKALNTSEVNDESGNGYHGKWMKGNETTTPSYGVDRFGDAGSSASFVSSDQKFIQVDDLPALGDNFTVACWVKRSIAAGSNARTEIVGGGSLRSGEGFHLFHYENTSKSFGADLSAKVGPTTSAASTFDWTHIAMVFDVGVVRIFENGIFKATALVSGNIQAGILRIGAARYFDFGNYWTGDIDDLRVYQQSLSETAILALSNDKPKNSAAARADNLDSVSKTMSENDENVVVLYPNPVDQSLTLQINLDSKPVDVYLVDAFGRIVKRHRAFSGELIMDVANVPSGIYFVKTASPEIGRLVKKVVIQH